MRVLLRGLTLDASWHAERMQGLGLLYALVPVLRQQADVRAALRRHAGCFNINVWMAPVLLGGMARLEMRGQGDEAVRLRERLAAPLSGSGDALVWGAVLPAALGAGIVLLLAGHASLAMGAVFAAYDLPLLWLCWRGFELQEVPVSGPGLEAVVRPRRWARWLRLASAALAGGLAVWAGAGAWHAAPATAFPVGVALVLGYYAAKRHLSPGITFLILVALASVARHVHYPSPVWRP